MKQFPSTAALVVRQTRYQILYFLRIPVALFFTILLPVVMLVLFNALFGDNTITTAAGEWPTRQFYTGGLAAYTAVSATYSNLGNMVPIRRDEGILKRWRSTPLPTWVYIAGLVLSSIVIAVVSVVLMLAMGVVFYDLSIDLGFIVDPYRSAVPGVLLGFSSPDSLSGLYRFLSAPKSFPHYPGRRARSNRKCSGRFGYLLRCRDRLRISILVRRQKRSSFRRPISRGRLFASWWPDPTYRAIWRRLPPTS